MQISVIVVSFNTKNLTLQCLHSLKYNEKNDIVEVIVIDNNSTDGSIEAIKQQFPLVKLIQNKENVGFSKANNLGAIQARGEYLLFLNSDTQVKNSAHLKLLELAQTHQSTLASCQLLNPNGLTQPQGGSLPTLGNVLVQMLFFDDLPLVRGFFPSYQQRNASFFIKDHEIGWIGGTAMLIKRHLFNKLGGFDENIFMYTEDVDLCWRAHKLGVIPRYFAKPQIIHFGQASSNSKRALVGEMKGLVYLFKKHQPSWKVPLLKVILKLGCALRIFIFGIILRDELKKSAYKQAFAVV